jgi:AAHS family 4-hydroxybenzoate transporter-like MFS transporter
MSVETGTIDVPALIDRQKVGGFQVLVAALCAAVVFMDGFDAQAIGYVAPSISKSWGLRPGALGPVFGAGLFGLMLGALVCGPLADRVGRKAVIVGCTLAFGICALLTATADSLTSLLVWRFLTGLGLGGAMPNAIALTSEYSPQRSRATMIMVMFCGFSIGSALGGVLAAKLIPAFGWSAVFLVGGAVPIAFAPVLWLVLPESIRLLALKGNHDRQVAALFSRVNPTLAFDDKARFTVHEAQLHGFPVAHLFRETRAPATLLLWVMFFMNLLDIYFLVSWLPTVIRNAGIALERAVIATAMLQVGGVIGTLVLGRLIDRFSPYHVLAVAYFLAAVFIACLGSAGSSVELIMALVFCAGFCVVGAQIGANALAATFYPTFIRSTGVGWALGIGRIGSIIGPVVGGILLSLKWDTASIFFVGAIPVLIAAAAASGMGWAGRGLAAAPPPAAPTTTRAAER